MSTIRCPHCGTTNRAGSYFCNRCGTDLRTDDALEETRGEQTPPLEQSASEATPPVASASMEATAPDFTADAEVEPFGLLAAPFDAEPLESAAFADEPADDFAEEPPPLATAGRLILGIQGLLEPVR